MFFVISKTIGLLTYPLFLFFVLIVLFLIVRKKSSRTGWTIFAIATVMLYGFSIRPVADLLMRPLETSFQQPEVLPQADAVVIMGGGIERLHSDTEHVELTDASDRLLTAIILGRKLPEAVIVFSGGSGDVMNQDLREAPLLKSCAVRMGIAPKRIRTESESRNTYENALHSSRLLRRESNIDTVILVTSAYHMPRSLQCFHRLGIRPVPYPVDFQNQYPYYDILSLVPEVDSLRDSTAAIHEYCGLVIYRLNGYI